MGKCWETDSAAPVLLCVKSYARLEGEVISNSFFEVFAFVKDSLILLGSTMLFICPAPLLLWFGFPLNKLARGEWQPQKNPG